MGGRGNFPAALGAALLFHVKHPAIVSRETSRVPAAPVPRTPNRDAALPARRAAGILAADRRERESEWARVVYAAR